MLNRKIHLQWSALRSGAAFRTAVSIHSHTLHSRESLSCIDAAASRSRILSWVAKRTEQRYCHVHGKALNLRRGWWTPPLGPREAWSVERRQIEGLGKAALVSLTDHDDIEAPMSLQVIERCRGVPISVEWTVPYGEIFFHLGVHNLPPGEARFLFDAMEEYRTSPRVEILGRILEEVDARPGVLLVFNHPLWDESGCGDDRHAAIACRFLELYGDYLHALEINGLRPWSENGMVLQLAEAFGKPIVSGGDRHALEPNAVLNLTNAGSFGEFVEEVRAGHSEVWILSSYREAYLSRVIRNMVDVLHTMEDHSNGWRLWSDRIFCPCEDGKVRSLSQLFEIETPASLAAFVGVIQLGSRPSVRKLMTDAFGEAERVTL